MADELELKYAVDDTDAVVDWLDHELPPDEGAGWRTIELTDTYFDTADQALARAGYAARLRRVGRETTVGLKSDISVDGALHQRAELEAAATPALEPAAWPASDVRELISRHTDGHELVARFVLRQRRRVRDVGGLELSVDEVSIRKGRREVGQAKELEVELKRGRRSGLRRIGRQLERSGLAHPEARSKMALAAAIVEGPPAVYPSDPLAEAGRKVLARLLDRLLEREQATRGGDTQALKQMRVATRRMRATWRAFAGAYRRADARRCVSELRDVARRLGTVRDLDVLLGNLPSEPGLAPLTDAWRARRDEAWQELLAMLDSPDYARFVTDYRAFATTPWFATTDRGRSQLVGHSGASRVWAAYELVRAAEPAAQEPVEADDLHALRIAARQFRYTIEAFRDVLDPAATTALMERLVRLQDVLGALNDADVAMREVATWLAEQPVGVGAVEDYRRLLEREAELLARAVGPAIQGVVGPPFRRLLGRAAAAI